MTRYLIIALMFAGYTWGAVKYGESRIKTIAVKAEIEFKDTQTKKVVKLKQIEVNRKAKTRKAVAAIKKTKLNEVRIPDEQWRAM